MVALLGVGCAGPEQKLGRGMSNAGEIVRLNEMQRSIEQGGVFYGTDTGIHPIWTSYLAPMPEYTDSYKPRKWDEPVFFTDDSLGFSGGDIAPWIPGSRFHVFDN
jgi:hypothetical protein